MHKEELCVLEVDPATLKVVPLAAEIETYGLRSEQILTSQVFGLQSDRNIDLEKRIQRHVDLFETTKPTKAQKKELAKLTDALRPYNYAGATLPNPPAALSENELDALRSRLESKRTVAKAEGEGSS